MFAKAEGDAFEDDEVLTAEDLGLVLAHVDVIPATIIVVVLVVLAPVAVEPGVESGVGGHGGGNVLAFLGHEVVGLSLIKVIEAGLVYFELGEGVVFATFFGVGGTTLSENLCREEDKNKQPEHSGSF